MSMELYKAARAKVQEARKLAQQVCKDAFTEASRELFAAHPEMESFGWTQYTPYFNDGDTCEFGVNTDRPSINGKDSIYEGYTYKDGRGGTVTIEPRFPELISAQKAVSEFLELFDGDDYEDMFGDNAEITVHRDGTIDVAEYDHE